MNVYTLLYLYFLNGNKQCLKKFCSLPNSKEWVRRFANKNTKFYYVHDALEREKFNKQYAPDII